MESWHISEEDMAEIKREVLERLRPYLCQKLVADRHLDFLRSRQVLSREDTEDVCCRVGSAKRTGRMLDYLAVDPAGLDCLVESIRRVRTKDFVLGRIAREVEELRRERKAAMLSARRPSPSSSTSGSHRGGGDIMSVSMSYSQGAQSWRQPLMCSPAGLVQEGSALANGVSSSLPKPGESGAPPLPTEELGPRESDQFHSLRSWVMSPP